MARRDIISAEAGRAGRLRQAFALGRLRQTTVAAQLGISSRTLGHYLAGRETRASTLVALAGICGVRVEWLGTGEGPMRPDPLAEPDAPLSLLERAWNMTPPSARRAFLVRVIDEMSPAERPRA